MKPLKRLPPESDLRGVSILTSSLKEVLIALQVPIYLAFAKSDWPAVPCQWMRIIGISRTSARAFIEKTSFNALNVFLSFDMSNIDTTQKLKAQKRGANQSPFHFNHNIISSISLIHISC